MRAWLKMVKKIYLHGGTSLRTEENNKLDSEILKEAPNKIVYFIDFAKQEMFPSYKKQMEDHFLNLGAEEVLFSSEDPEIKKNIRRAGFLFIAGGNTELLIERILKEDLVRDIKEFEGVIEGISAGAYLLCNEYPKIREGKLKRIKALGIVDAIMKAHYTEEFEKELKEFSKEEGVYGVSDNSWLVIENKEITLVGKILKFENGLVVS